MTTNCKVCKSQSKFFAEEILLGKYKVNYFQCSNCGFVQTEEPHWLAEAYSDAIAKTDVGLVFRNHHLSQKASQIIFQLFDHDAKFLDYGGGYGLFVRQMRDYGFNFYWFDKFCNNLFAQGFEIDKNESNSYELVTAFEVFEHFVDPLQEIEHILQFSRNILFSTEILPESNPKPNEWWYYATHEGQHISLYTFASLSIIAEKYNLNFYSNGTSLHLLTEKTLLPDIFYNVCHSQPQHFKKESLLANDYSQAVKTLINNYYPGLSEFSTKEIDLNESPTKNLTILIDGVFFQLYQTGIARVWKSLLEEWAINGFAKQIIVLDRVGTAPKIAGIRYLNIPSYDYHDIDTDRAMLQQVCEQEGADLFISSYYTTPLTTPSVFMAYDMIPEVMKWDMNNPMWQAKHQAIKQALAYIAISENTAKDLAQFFSHIPQESVSVAYCGVKHPLSPASSSKVNSFKTKYGITKPYFLLVGTGSGYKNGILFFQAFSQLASGSGFDIVSTGIGTALTSEFRVYTSGSVVHTLQLSDEDLAVAYSGAVALVYPSKYEGFGMPVIEAMACGCPVITCRNASIPEVAGDAAIYVQDHDVDGLVDALCEVQKPGVRQSLIDAGLAQAKKFSWTKMADIVSSALIDATLLSLNLKEVNLIIFPDCLQAEEVINAQLAEVIKILATRPDCEKVTLLIYISDIAVEDVELLLSAITMNLLMQDDVDVSEELEISLVQNLADIQWEALLPKINAIIPLKHEVQNTVIQDLMNKLTPCSIDNLNNQIDVFLETETSKTKKIINNCRTYNIKDIPIIIPTDHALPYYQSRFRLYDKFLGILAQNLPNVDNLIIDIGANIGDTTALLLQYCLNPIVCIEADEEFFHIMKYNLSLYSQRTTLINSFVSGNRFQNVEIIKNQGTGRAIENKNKTVKSDSLESIIIDRNLGECVLLKTDTDGFDFEILLSSLNIIKKDNPILYWENEISSQKDVYLAKELLNSLLELGYENYIVMDNFGNPLIYGCSSLFLEQINEYLFSNVHNKNHTFYYTDVVAFPKKYSSLISGIISDYNDFIKDSRVYP